MARKLSPVLTRPWAKDFFDFFEDVRTALNGGADLLRTMVLSTAQMSTNAASAARLNTPVGFAYFADGTFGTVAASGDLATVSGYTIGSQRANVFVFTVDSDGSMGVYQGTEAASVGAVTLPTTVPTNVAKIGLAFVSALSTADWTGGTTTFSGYTTYYNIVGPLDWTVADVAQKFTER